MKKLYIILLPILIIISFSFLNSCKRERVSVLITTDISEISYTSASSGGEVIDDGGSSIISLGICWDTAINPTINRYSTAENIEMKSFESSMSQLTPNTEFFVRAYATNSSGTGYGNQVSFTTTKPETPSLSTLPVISVTASTAVTGGNIISDNGSDIFNRGVCYSTNHNPEVLDLTIFNNSDTCSFTCKLEGLTSNTTYYVRSFAENTVGIAFGSEVSFTTSLIITTSEATNILNYSAMLGGIILAGGNSEIFSRGIYYGLSPNPENYAAPNPIGIGSGVYSKTVTDLIPGRLYYVKAYAFNSCGTFYGNQVNFTTIQTPSVTTISVTNITAISANTGGVVTSTGGLPVTSRGVCVSTSINPNIIQNYKTSDGSGPGEFSSILTGLGSGATYYVRAYATNDIGTGYGDQVSFTTIYMIPSVYIAFNPQSIYESISDIDGNTYKTIKIGAQTWMAENLKTTKFNDGSPIQNVNTSWTDLVSPAYCWAKVNNEYYKDPYGAYYNWFSVNTGKLCPTGWHVPKDEEWATLLGGYTDWHIPNDVGESLKENGYAHWVRPYNYIVYSRNGSGFTALPGGSKPENGVSSFDLGYFANWWSATEYDASMAIEQSMRYDNPGIWTPGARLPKYAGLSVRCVKD